jgi:hypothetical protein
MAEAVRVLVAGYLKPETRRTVGELLAIGLATPRHR